MKNKIAIIGIGEAGRSLCKEIQKKGIVGDIVCFVDDNKEKIGKVFENIIIEGPISDIQKIQKKHKADEALIAIPSASRKRIKEIYALLQKGNFKRILILPGISQIIDGSAHLIQAREISTLDILGRNPVVIPLKKTLEYLRDTRVLITGAGGSIGSELARQLLSAGASRLYLFGHGENSIYETEKELRLLQKEGVGEKATIIPIIGELQDRDFTHFLLERVKADVIFHCAAYKHVPMMEVNPVQAVKNNVFGTKNLTEAAARSNVRKFILISTDKAVEPIGIYGATKLICEDIVLSQKNTNTDYMVVRFGNVLGSRGSILPLFREQILSGGPLTITHPQIMRFFMTIPEAVSLVLKTADFGKSGNLYILDMGDPLLIKDIAEQMIRFYGLEPDIDIEITYTGIRPGEKFMEKLWRDDEKIKQTETQRVNILIERINLGEKLDKLLSELYPICYFTGRVSNRYRNRHMLRKILKKYIPTIERPENEPEY
ncbi:MAG: polysaccharide biosynthesis protein [Spirochaetia bacterium]|jgi:FlaA1/EpsC-like NDP-sugar epimerase|nr:polysaccharide biosynthesis protein [Spirochaetia bacterium]